MFFYELPAKLLPPQYFTDKKAKFAPSIASRSFGLKVKK
jgi:hypothetical protein